MLFLNIREEKVNQYMDGKFFLTDYLSVLIVFLSELTTKSDLIDKQNKRKKISN
jgi:hypothetical protein